MNEFTGIRLAKVNFEPTTATTYVSTASLPLGAIVKSITTVEGVALAGGTTVTFKAGSQALTAAIATASFTGVDTHALTDTDGLAVTADSFISITTVGTYSAGDIDVYIQYYV